MRLRQAERTRPVNLRNVNAGEGESIVADEAEATKKHINSLVQQSCGTVILFLYRCLIVDLVRWLCESVSIEYRCGGKG